MEEARSFFQLLIVVILASLVPLALTSVRGRLAVPIVVGEIVAGMIVGRSGLGWVLPGDHALILLKELGFVFLMFLSGMEIDFRSLRRNAGDPTEGRWSPLALAAMNFAVTFAFALVCAVGLRGIGATTDPWTRRVTAPAASIPPLDSPLIQVKLGHRGDADYGGPSTLRKTRGRPSLSREGQRARSASVIAVTTSTASLIDPAAYQKVGSAWLRAHACPGTPAISQHTSPIAGLGSATPRNHAA